MIGFHSKQPLTLEKGESMSKLHIGEIITLFVSIEGLSKRVSKEIISVDTKGIIGDKYYNKDVNRSVLLTSTSSYKLAKSHQIILPFGSLGENILIDYTPYHLASGSKLYIGDSILEISQNCTICNHLSKIDKKLPKLLKDDRGIFVRVLQSGDIKIGDKIYLEEKI